MAWILELRTEQGALLTQSFQDPVPVFYIEHDPSTPPRKRTFAELQTGDRVSTEPRHFKELINVRVI
jgi:hypothetical protein